MLVTGGTPRAIVSKINAKIVELLNAPAVTERFAGAGLEPVSSTPEEFASVIRNEIPRWKQVVKAGNIHIE